MEINFSKKADRDLTKIPPHIRTKFEYWLDLIQTLSLREVRKYKGFHDEPLSGNRMGQRSVRLSKAYRAIYIENEKGIVILEVNKHEY